MKKLFIALFVLLASVILFSVSASAASSHPMFGDTDLNGEINARDALAILRYAVGKGDIDPNLVCFSDTNTDYSVNASDALNVLKYSVGKIRRFSADNGFDGAIFINSDKYDDMFMQLGCTRAVACYFECYESEYTVQWEIDNSYLTGSWTEEWTETGSLEDMLVLFLTVQNNPNRTKYVPVRVSYKQAPGIYRVFTVEVAPTDNDLITAYNFVQQWTPDFGDMNYTAPYYMDYQDLGESELVTLRYDGATLLNNTNGANTLYDDYLQELVDYYDFYYVRHQEGEHTWDNEIVFTNYEEDVWIYAELYEDEYGDQVIELQFINVY